MPLKEQDLVITKKDENGNTVILQPITRAENVEGALMTVNNQKPDANGNVNVQTYTHPTSGVTAGSYNKVTVNAQGHVTAGENVSVVKTVNGNAPDSNGNLSLVDIVYPVGSIYMSVNAANPGTLFGGTWEALDQGRVLIGAGTAHPAGETGGEETHKLTTSEMPSHSHSGSTASAGSHTHSGSTSSAGSHSHTRGSMNITGKLNYIAHGATVYASASGALSVSATSTYTGNATAPGNTEIVSLNAASNWTGSTSSEGSHSHTMSLDNAGSHTHTVTIESAGSGSAHNNMQPYLSVYMWKRTA